mmetsp:Transcript_17192/g.46564  ORF Transcript_17192/g.46564 Transcript_17192/m.46564 type:complete len:148 (-) Transcript_17192:169-612(-)
MTALCTIDFGVHGAKWETDVCSDTLCVKNTFIEVLSPCQGGRTRKRTTRSCPPPSTEQPSSDNLFLYSLESSPGGSIEVCSSASTGVSDHTLGLCVPCAFFHKPAGCLRGVECPYCHLCGPDSRRLYKKERRQRKGMERKIQQGEHV